MIHKSYISCDQHGFAEFYIEFFSKTKKNNNEEQIDSNEDGQDSIERTPRHEADSSLEIPVAKFSQWDINSFIMVKPTNEQKHNLMIRCWEPAKNHAFPCSYGR